MDLIFYYVTWLGSILVLLPATVMIVISFWRSLQASDIILLLGGLLGASLITHLLKLLFSRPRPDMGHGMLVDMPTDFSFPSAHTAQATSFFLSLALIATRMLPIKTSITTWALAVLITAMVGFSRIYLKVHYTSDVLIGAFVGIVWIYILTQLIATFVTGGNHA